jgi:hypothetical protein
VVCSASKPEMIRAQWALLESCFIPPALFHQELLLNRGVSGGYDLAVSDERLLSAVRKVGHHWPCFTASAYIERNAGYQLGMSYASERPSTSGHRQLNVGLAWRDRNLTSKQEFLLAKDQ